MAKKVLCSSAAQEAHGLNTKSFLKVIFLICSRARLGPYLTENNLDPVNNDESTKMLQTHHVHSSKMWAGPLFTSLM